jgi:ATP-dependent DNA helicase RecG
MEKFQEGEIDILITTSMVEVGIDVPEATVMIVESADRFGLSQLHQLRGRVGRGKDRGVCVLFADPKTEEAKERLRAIKDCHDGFSLAEADLRIRGEGSLFGTRQSGLPDLKFVRLARDYKLIKSARLCAFKIIENDPRLSLPENAALKKETARRFGKTLEWLFKA